MKIGFKCTHCFRSSPAELEIDDRLLDTLTMLIRGDIRSWDGLYCVNTQDTLSKAMTRYWRLVSAGVDTDLVYEGAILLREAADVIRRLETMAQQAGTVDVWKTYH